MKRNTHKGFSLLLALFVLGLVVCVVFTEGKHQGFFLLAGIILGLVLGAFTEVV